MSLEDINGPVDDQEEDLEDVPDDIDRILDMVDEMRRAGIRFHSSDDEPEGKVERRASNLPAPNSYGMFKSRQRFGR